MQHPAPPSPAGGGIEQRVLDVVAELVTELRGGVPAAVARGDSLETDLGISSLERVELLIRLERTFGVRLGDAAMSDAETPADLATAIAEAHDTPEERRTERPAASGSGVASAASARTVVEALAWHAERAPERIHIHLREENGDETPLTYGWLWREAQAVAGGLAERGLGRGDRVAIMLRTEERFFPTFVGTLMAGCVPVPLYPPFRLDRIEEYVGRQAAILHNAGARILVTFSDVARVAGLLVRQVPSLDAVVSAEDVSGEPRRPVPATAEDPALIQYTSGSTGQPKGVLLSHANLLANIRALESRFAITSRDVGVSWLPLYHDMGLIGAWLGPLYFGAPLALMSPLAFLARPIRWLEALDAHRGTLSPAPNFAFDLCTTRIADEELDGLDLSAARVLLNGSEPVSPATLHRFIERFAPCGLDPRAVYPVYGLAECSLGLSTPDLGSAIRIDRVRRSKFQASGQADPAADDDRSALRFVSCGRALPDHELAVFGRDGNPAPDRVQGRVRFRGPSTTRGYYRNEEATRDLIGTDGWLDSGDLGYLADGELFLTGRAKDLIIKAGRNFQPHEVEALAGSVPGVRTGCVAAFGAADAARGTEQFVIVAETRVVNEASRADLVQAVTRKVGLALGTAPDRVVLAPPGSVAKTSSGKIRRGATRDAWLAGRIGRGRAGVAMQWLRLAAAAAAATAAAWASHGARALFTGYVLAVVLGTAPIGWGLLLLIPRGRGADRIVGRWNRLVMRLAGCPLEVVGRESVPAAGPVVFVANHASFIDSPVMMSALPVAVRFAVKARLGTYPLIGLAIRKGNHIPLGKRDQYERVESADTIRAPLDAGASLFVFPEGTFEAAPRLLPFRLGAFRAAVDAGCPVVPVAIRGTRHIWPAGTWLLRRGRVKVTFGAPLRAPGSDWSEIVRLRDEARAFIAEHCGEPYR